MKAILMFNMPKKCNECPCYNDEYYVCQMRWKRVDAFEKIVDWCPLRPISDRLGDRLIESLDARQGETE